MRWSRSDLGRWPCLAEHQVGGYDATLGTTTLLRMKTLALSFLIYYTAVLAVIGIYGLHRYWMVWVFWRSRRRGGETEPAKRFERLPRVTVQLPMFNERHVAKRVIEAACAIDYPRDLLEIQVLDDSTDESAQIAQSYCAQMAAAGHDVRYIHRTNRAGFKAGALANGLKFFTQAPPQGDGSRDYGTHHAAEIVYVFDNLGTRDVNWDDTDIAVAAATSGY